MTRLFSVKKIIIFFILFLISLPLYAQNIVESNEIPHVIHYVWFGDKEPPQNVKKAIQTWQEQMPDWEIKRWNETNCDVNNNDFVKHHLEKKNYNFASDYCRVYALEKEGGVYFDTDTILNKSIEPYLSEPLILVKEHDYSLAASSIGAVPHHPFFKKILEKYQNSEAFNYANSPRLFTAIFQEMYQKDLTPIHKKGSFILYEANVLILDFKGPENAASHLYANGSTEGISDCRGFCRIFKQRYLNNHAYRLVDQGNQYLIAVDKKNCYTVQLKNNDWVSKTPNKTYPCSVDKDVIAYTTPSKETFVYPCVNKVGCMALENIKQVKSYSCKHPYWKDEIFTYRNRAYRLKGTSQATVLEQSDEKLCVKWDEWGKECFIWNKEKKAYVLDK